MEAIMHRLKIKSEFFEAVKDGRKTFKIINNDRGFQVGDTIELFEVFDGAETGERIIKKISYVLSGRGLKEDYVCLGLKNDQGY